MKLVLLDPLWSGTVARLADAMKAAERDPTEREVSFIFCCNHGKQRSVACAELAHQMLKASYFHSELCHKRLERTGCCQCSLCNWVQPDAEVLAAAAKTWVND